MRTVNCDTVNCKFKTAVYVPHLVTNKTFSVSEPFPAEDIKSRIMIAQRLKTDNVVHSTESAITL